MACAGSARSKRIIIHRDLKPGNLMLGGIPFDTDDGSIAQARCRRVVSVCSLVELWLLWLRLWHALCLLLYCMSCVPDDFARKHRIFWCAVSYRCLWLTSACYVALQTVGVVKIADFGAPPVCHRR